MFVWIQQVIVKIPTNTFNLFSTVVNNLSILTMNVSVLDPGFLYTQLTSSFFVLSILISIVIHSITSSMTTDMLSTTWCVKPSSTYKATPPLFLLPLLIQWKSQPRNTKSAPLSASVRVSETAITLKGFLNYPKKSFMFWKFVYKLLLLEWIIDCHVSRKGRTQNARHWDR